MSGIARQSKKLEEQIGSLRKVSVVEQLTFATEVVIDLWQNARSEDVTGVGRATLRPQKGP